MFSALLIVLAAFVTFVLTPLTMQLANRLGRLDNPDPRKIHKTPIPRLAGIAIFAGVLAGTLCGVIYFAEFKAQMPSELIRQYLAIAAGGIFVFLVGLVDDIRSVSGRFKLVALIAGSAMVCGSGATLGELVFGGHALVHFQWLDWLITITWIVSVAAAINFIDGLDGLAAGVVLLAAATLCVFLLVRDNMVAGLLPLALIGSLGGFLVFNWHPAKTFMGDSGSLSIGFLIASSIVVANQYIGSMRAIVIPTLALSVPLIDLVLTMFRRHYLQRRSLFSAERGHIHHNLLDRGLSHRQAVVTILIVSLMAVLIGFVSLAFEGWATVGGLSLLLPLLWGAFRFAGSMRTLEMMQAFDRKRDLDRKTQSYRSHFESLQLEFYQVKTFSEWWQSICFAAERLEFIRLELSVISRDGSQRKLTWTSTQDWGDCTRLTADVPIADRRYGADPLIAHVEIACSTSLESAGQRLALFSRLMADHSLASLLARCPDSSSRIAARTVNPLTLGNGKVSTIDNGPFGNLRVAIVHDFLYIKAGAERVVEQLIKLFPHADMFALFDFLPEEQRGFLQGKKVTTTFLQRMPGIRKRHRFYLPLMPFAIEQLDLSEYDVIVSSSYLSAKGVITGPDQLHVCYCHSPARYAWDLQHQYLAESGLGFGVKGILARLILHYLRNWDVRSAIGVDHFLANSKFVARRIQKVYRREATVVYPPVDTDQFYPHDEREEFYLVASRMVPYKRTDLIVKAFSRTPHRKLVVIGDGPDFEKVRSVAGPNVQLLGFQENEQLVHYMQRAKALVFAAEEDFGIVPVEAMACGTPVIAFGRGGVTESVPEGKYGVFFASQTEQGLLEALDRFERMPALDEADRADLRKCAERFSHRQFEEVLTNHIQDWVKEKWPRLSPAAPSKVTTYKVGEREPERIYSSPTAHKANTVPEEDLTQQPDYVA